MYWIYGYTRSEENLAYTCTIVFLFRVERTLVPVATVSWIEIRKGRGEEGLEERRVNEF